MAIGVAIVLTGSVRLLEAIGLEYAFEDYALAAALAALAVAAVDLQSGS